MASRNQQSHAKRARELAVKEKRERKRAKKAARLAGEPWGDDVVTGEGEAIATAEGEAIATAEGEAIATAEAEDTETTEDAASANGAS